MNFVQPEKQWHPRQMPGNITEEQIKNIARAVGVPENIVRILALRGISDIEQINTFMAPSLRQLPRPHLMKDMDKAVAILLDALKLQEPVTVFGDFDADGITSTAILFLFFTELFMELQTYIPDRMAEGYGLNSEALRKIYNHNMQKRGKAGVLLTVDCGISDVEVVREAKELGFTVIVTDHHRPSEILPPADAILNPLQPGCPFPCKNLAGVGVAFYLILGIRTELITNGHWPEDKIPNLKSYMDLVAIGTVADQVPVTGCNRIIIRAGLEILNQVNRMGLRKLFDIAKINYTRVTVEDIAFRMAPRINAVGRIGSARKAVNLMITSFSDEAQQFAADLENSNHVRKNIEAQIFAEAADMITQEILDSCNSLVLHKNDWHQGVLGIVASRISEQFHCPTILLTDCPLTDSNESLQLMKGSGRSVNGIDIHTAVSACQAKLHRFGGHEGAVGLTLEAGNLEIFRQLFDAAIANQVEKKSTLPSLLIDMQTTLDSLTDKEFLTAYTNLAPFGTGNPEPVFYLKAQNLSNPRLVGTNHLRFSIVDNNRSINGIGFGLGSMVEAAQSSPMDLAFTLRLNTYMGQDKWELNLIDLRPSNT